MSDGMDTASGRFVVGIDLGTTNCTLAAASLEEERARPEAQPIPQVVHVGEVAAPPRLPSFLYLPAAGELAEGALALPWDPAAQVAVGTYALSRGAEVPGRVVASAKSWLCHDGVDRRSAILPAGAPDDVAKLSPVEASARYLGHLRAAWDQAHPDAPLVEQDVVVTVPASFDAVARGLTEEAIRGAGLHERVTLLEEPQAALYAFIADHGDSWREHLSVGDVILVCDLGGGTTDFSLIAVGEQDGNLTLERVAVGDHILLGGDNMDLALAWKVKLRLEEEGKTIDDWQLRGLTHSCRAAKEAILEDAAVAGRTVVVPGRGRKLIGGSLSAELTRSDVEETVLAGFLPEVGAADRPQSGRRAALTTLGLPYATDAGITRHLAAFLGGPGLAGGAALQPGGRSFLHPTTVLFNGGVTRSAGIRERLVAILNRWLADEGGAPVKILEGADPDVAVSRGAAYYGQVRRGHGVRIKGGTQRAYYVGIERAELAVPGIPPRLDAVCVAPFGMEEGSDTELLSELGLVVGEPASFRFFASHDRRSDEVSQQVEPSALEELPPIETTIAPEAGQAAGQVVPVKLHSRITEVGTLELSAVEVATGRRHKLEFDVRVG